MRRKRFATMQCPVARTLERVGDWWSLLILRDAMFGASRFDEFRENLGISPNILSRRLKHLVESGIFERIVSGDSPVRVQYRLTPLGRDFEPVLLYLHTFGNAHFADEGKSAVVVHRATGKNTDLAIIDKHTGQEVRWPEFAVVPGPAAKSGLVTKLTQVNNRIAADLGTARRVRVARRTGVPSSKKGRMWSRN